MSTLPCYCDRTFEVEVELVPDSHLMFRGQRIEMPPGMNNVLFPRIAPDGSRFAGIGHRHDERGDGQCWEWDGAWHDRGPTHGTQSVIYGHDGVLHVVRQAGEPAGSQGWRYVDPFGRLVPSWETYDPTTPFAKSLGVDHLLEWTPLGDVIIGQGGDEGGMQALVQGRRVLLAEGDCRFIHAYRRGDVFAIAYVHEGQAAFPMFTLSELLAMPTYAIPGTTPPNPPEEPPVSEPASLLPDVEAEYAKYAKPLKPEDYGTILNAVAWKNRAEGWGLSEKPNGNHVMSPQGKWVAYDILHHQPSNTLWGCFNDSGPNWGVEDYHGDPNGRPWLAPVQPVGGDDGDPGDEDEPKPPVDLPKPEPCTECVGLKAKVDELEELLLDMARAADERFVKLENAKPPELVLPPLVARGKQYGLKFELPVEKK